MGESKRRKQNDPNYGRVPQNSRKRGLVISPSIEIEGSRLIIKSSANIDLQELRFALFFWDKLVWPYSNNIYFASGPDEEFLESADILTRPNYTFSGDGAQSIAKAQIQAFLDLDKNEPGCWALAQGENSLLLKDDAFDQNGKGAFVELHRAIPVPAEDVPLIEILEFKQRRRDELLLMRHLLDSFVSEIEITEDKSIALQKRIKEIDSACADLLKVGREWQFPVFLSNIKASFNINAKMWPYVVGGWVAGKTYGLTSASAAACAALAGVSSILEVKGDIGFRSIKRPQTPYRYAHQIHKEFGRFN